MKHSRQDMLSGPLLPSIVSYTVPIILTGLLQLLFNAADLVVVGTRGEIYLSAVGATNAITNLIVNLFIGLSVGAGVTMAHAMGCRDQQAIHRTVHTALPTAFSLYPHLTKDTAYGFLTRGCPRGCDFCIVGKKEGRCSVKVADLNQFWGGAKEYCLMRS